MGKKMQAFQILDVKDFMSKLLMQNYFDSFGVIEITIVTYNTFVIDGHLQMDFFSAEEQEEWKEQTLSKWEALRPVCFQLIKGRKTPKSFKIIFQLLGQELEKLIGDSGTGYKKEEIEGLFLNMKYENGSLFCTTGASMRLFTMDKSLEQYWDKTIQEFFKKCEIACE